MTKQNNAECAICGKSYSVCRSCSEVKSFMPWRTVTDTISHYAIYMAVHGYTISKDKINAKKELEKCDLFGLENFNPEIKKIINEIFSDDSVVAKTKKSYRKLKVNTSNAVKDENKEVLIKQDNE